MLKHCINFLAKPGLTVWLPLCAACIVLRERQIPSCMALSKPIAQHFHCLSSTENYLSAVDIHGCGLIVCCIKNCICLSEWFGDACSPLHVCGLLPMLEVRGVWGMEQSCSLGSAVPLGSVSEGSCPPRWHWGTWGGGTAGAPTAALPMLQTHRSSQPGCHWDAFNRPCLVRVPWE